MRNNNYKILVLSDLKSSSKTTINSAVSLAKMIGGTVDLFHVKTPSDVVLRENQLSAIRCINEQHHKIRNKINELITPISEEHEISIKHNFEIGNVKNEIGKYINETQPDIIVLGKRKPKRLNFIGDSITHFMLTNYGGVVFIAAKKNALQPNKKFAIGMLNDFEQSFNIDFANDLMAHSETPVKSFKILKKNNSTLNIPISPNKIVEYVFEQGDNAVKNLSKYLLINNINLLYVNRKNGTDLIESNIKQTMDSLNVSILVGKE